MALVDLCGKGDLARPMDPDNGDQLLNKLVPGIVDADKYRHLGCTEQIQMNRKTVTYPCGYAETGAGSP